TRNDLPFVAAFWVCPLRVSGGHRSTSAQRPLYPQKRTLELSLRTTYLSVGACRRRRGVRGFNDEIAYPSATEFLRDDNGGRKDKRPNIGPAVWRLSIS